MNLVDNLKSTQCKKLFITLKSSHVQSLNIFGARQGLLFEFTCLIGVWKFEKLFSGPGPHVSGSFLLDCPGRLPGPVRRPNSWWPCSPHGERSAPMVARSSPCTWVGPSLALLRTSPRKPSPTPLFPNRCPSLMRHPELSERAKRSSSSPRPSCTKSLPTAPASEARPRDFPAVVFLCECLTNGIPL
jgi:hypothetical protein